MRNIDIIKRLYNNYTKQFLPKILLSVFFSVLVAGSTASIAWLLDPAIKKIFIDKDQTLILVIPFAIILAFSTKGASLYFAKTILIRVGQEITKILQFEVMKSIINADSQIVEKKHSGKFISHLTFDVGMITNLVSTVILNITKDTFTLIGLLGVMFYQNWRLALFAIIMIPLASFAARSLGKRMGKVTTEAADRTGLLTSHLLEVFKNHKIIKIFQKENFEFSRTEKFINNLKEKVIKIQTVLVRASPIMEILTGIMIAGLIFYSAKLILKNELDISSFFSFLAAMMLAYQPVRSLATLNMGINQGLAAAKRILPIIDMKNEIMETENPNNLVECIKFSEKEIQQHGLKAPMVGHVGDGNFHVTVIYDPAKEGEYKIIRDFSDKLIDKALELEGTITGEHGIGLQKKKYLLKEHPDNLPVMKSIKRSIDPNNIMNPGKVFDLN